MRKTTLRNIKQGCQSFHFHMRAGTDFSKQQNIIHKRKKYDIYYFVSIGQELRFVICGKLQVTCLNRIKVFLSNFIT